MHFVDADGAAIGNSSGPNSTIAGMPSSTLPRMMKTTIETARKPAAAGQRRHRAGEVREKPDWVSAQAMPVAAPMMSRIAPDSDAVSTSIGKSRRQSNWR